MSIFVPLYNFFFMYHVRLYKVKSFLSFLLKRDLHLSTRKPLILKNGIVYTKSRGELYHTFGSYAIAFSFPCSCKGLPKQKVYIMKQVISTNAHSHKATLALFRPRVHHE